MATSSQPATRGAGRSKRVSTNAQIWLPYWIFFAIAALGLAIAVTFSCFSRSTSDLHIMSASPLYLVNGLQAYINGGHSIVNHTTGQNDSAFPAFDLQALPDRYLFGITGVCRQFFSNSTTSCRRGFGPNPSILPLILSDLTSSTARQSWTVLLSSSGISSPQQDRLWQRLSTASAALLVASIACPCITAILIIARKTDRLMALIANDLLSGVMSVAAASMWTSMTVALTTQYSSGVAQTDSDWLTSDIVTPPAGSAPLTRSAFVYGPGFGILWATAGSHLSVMFIMVAVIMMFLMFFNAWAEGNAA